nr:S-layer homology domain-containing protein [Vallitaleaceae bacterium]
NKGLAVIEQKDIYLDKPNTYQVFKNNEDAVPSVLRTVTKSIDITVDSHILYGDDKLIAPWAYEAVYAARGEGIMVGYNNRLTPKETLTREQLITMLMKMTDYTIDNYDTEFSDVVPGSWYYDYVSTGEYNEVVEGVSDKLFGTGDLITRAEFAKMITLVFGLAPKDDLVDYTDLGGLDEATQLAIDAVSDADLFTGFDGEYMPNDYVTREMAAVVMMRISQME